MYNGYWESWKNEVAAYELDKLLQIHMVPPSVGRTIKGAEGAAIYWVHDIKMWKELKDVPKPNTPEWNVQLMHMKMFDDLIGNPDRNQGNLMYDPDFHLILIDHSRAFVRDRKLLVPLAHVDQDDLPEPLARDLGWLQVRVSRALHAVGGVGRVHIWKVGDGAEHLHWWFFARPEGVLQMRGSSLSDWSDCIPPMPQEEWDEVLRDVAAELAAGGGTALV
jgi:hypothetical protein